MSFCFSVPTTELFYWATAIVDIFPDEDMKTWYSPDNPAKKGLLVNTLRSVKTTLDVVSPEVEERPKREPLASITDQYQDDLRNILSASEKTFVYLKDDITLDKNARLSISKTLVEHLLEINKS
jgi:hypothetical protein